MSSWFLTDEERAATPAKATRAAYGETLNELIEEGKDLMVVDADLSGSTTTRKVREAHPDRFVNVGIAEQNMMGVAAGLALSGSTVFTGSFSVFGAGRDYDQIRNTVCESSLDVKVCPTHAGISVGPDGGSHQMLEDFALMRVLPGMQVMAPCDYQSAKKCIRLAAERPGPFYIRLARAPFPQLYTPEFKVRSGGSQFVRMGDDITILACGYEVHEALKAADVLAEDGVSAEVIDVYSIKPLDYPNVLRSARKTGKVICCEEHELQGGLGEAVAAILAEFYPVPMLRVGVKDKFGQSGTFEELLAAYELDSEAILEAADSLL
jgi:transketolase